MTFRATGFDYNDIIRQVICCCWEFQFWWSPSFLRAVFPLSAPSSANPLVGLWRNFDLEGSIARSSSSDGGLLTTPLGNSNAH